MAERREERRRQVGPLTERLGLLPFGKKMGPLDSDGDDTPQCIERPHLELSAFGRQNPNRLRAQAKWNQRRLRASIADHEMAAVCTLARVVPSGPRSRASA